VPSRKPRGSRRASRSDPRCPAQASPGSGRPSGGNKRPTPRRRLRAMDRMPTDPIGADEAQAAPENRVEGLCVIRRGHRAPWWPPSTLATAAVTSTSAASIGTGTWSLPQAKQGRHADIPGRLLCTSSGRSVVMKCLGRVAVALVFLPDRPSSRRVRSNRPGRLRRPTRSVPRQVSVVRVHGPQLGPRVGHQHALRLPGRLQGCS
jgi:hypothetical protein